MTRRPVDDRSELLPPKILARTASVASAAAATVLLADDDDSFRAAMREVLEAEGYAVREAANGIETIELLASAADGNEPAPDRVVLDVSMPGYSGLGVLGLMRRLASRPRVIVVTALADRSVREFAGRLGASRVLTKPVDLDVLLGEVLVAAKRGPDTGGRSHRDR